MLDNLLFDGLLMSDSYAKFEITKFKVQHKKNTIFI